MRSAYEIISEFWDKHKHGLTVSECQVIAYRCLGYAEWLESKGHGVTYSALNTKKRTYANPGITMIKCNTEVSK